MDSKTETEFEEFAYRVYISDSLKIALGINTRYIDLIQLINEEEEDGDEIAKRIIEQAGLHFED